MSVGDLPWSATSAALTAAALSASMARGASQLIVVRGSWTCVHTHWCRLRGARRQYVSLASQDDA